MSKRNPARNVRPGLPKWNSVSGTDHELYVAPEKAKRAGSPPCFTLGDKSHRWGPQLNRPRNRPDEADHLTGDGRDSNILVLTACGHGSIALAKPHLCLPGDVQNLL